MALLDLNQALSKLVMKVDQIEGIVIEQGTAKAWDALDNGAKKLLSKVGIDAAELRSLFSFVDQVTADPSLKLATEEWKVPLGTGLSVTGRIGGHLIIDLVLPTDSEQYSEFQQANMALVAIDQELQLANGVSVNLPIKLLNLANDSQANLKWRVKVVCAVAHDQKLISFLGQLVKQKMPLLSIEKLTNVINAQYPKHAMQGVIIHQTRAVSSSTTATLGHVWSVSSSDKVLDIKVNTSAGVALKASYAFTGDFKIVIKPADVGLQIDVHQLSNHIRDKGISLDAMLNLEGLDKVAETYLATPLESLDGAAKKLQDLLEAYKEPGTWLLAQFDEHLAQELSSENWQDIALLVADGNSDGLSTEVGAAVKQKLSLALSVKHLDWMSHPGDVSEQITQYLEENTFLTPAMLDRLKLKDFVGKSCNKAKERVLDEISSIAELAQDQVKPLLTPLKQLKDAKTKLKGQLNNQQLVEVLTGCVTAWLAQYNQARTTFSKAIKKAADLQLGLSVYGSHSQQTNNQAMLSFNLLNTSSAASQSLYQDVLLGKQLNLDALHAMQNKGNLSQLSGWLVKSSKVSKEIGLKLNLGDSFSFSEQSFVEKIARAKVAHTGQLLALNAKSVVRHASKTLKESRNAEFVSAFDVLAALKFGGSPNIGIGLSFEDKGVMTPAEMQQFLAPLTQEPWPLIDNKSYLLALDRFKVLCESKQLSRSIIECHLSLSTKDIGALANADAGEIEASAIDLLYNMTLSSADKNQIAFTSKNLVIGKKQLEVFLEVDITSSAPSGAETSFKLLQDRVRGILKNAQCLSQFVAIYGKLTQQIESVNSKDPTAYINIVNQANEELIDTMQSFIRVRGWFSGLFTEALPKTTMVLLIILAKYLGRDEPLLTPVISYDRSGKTEVL
ncbi:hypothetical protein [Agarivorans sp. DSG3-1]|uniref:hypothetical protein n=1 Tax=Agarivorans sp. DSG3-1 TaxID=3342249 RepID=UPI00398EDC44